MSVHPAKHNVISTEHLAQTLLWGGIRRLWEPSPADDTAACTPQAPAVPQEGLHCDGFNSLWGESQQRAAWMMSACACPGAQHGQLLPQGKEQLCLID